jgi:hypothetical protein
VNFGLIGSPSSLKVIGGSMSKVLLMVVSGSFLLVSCGGSPEISKISKPLPISDDTSADDPTISQFGLNKGEDNLIYTIEEESVFEGITFEDVDSVEIFVDEWSIGRVKANNKKFKLKYLFSSTGEERHLELVGYDHNGEEIVAKEYLINVLKKSSNIEDKLYFNEYILKAVEYLNSEYHLLGYSINAILTHDLEYSDLGTIYRTYNTRTMCVAAQLEVIITAFEIYAEETGDYTVYNYLPKRSWERLSINDIKGHIWVNHNFDSYGTADALVNFGMGERVSFEELKPGGFVNINRNNRTGHAVTFLAYIDRNGNEYKTYNDSVIGFKYFSAQGKYAIGSGGFEKIYAIFSKYGCPSMPGKKRDCGVIYSKKRSYLNTGHMLAPKFWSAKKAKDIVMNRAGITAETVFDGTYFNGVITDN